MKSRQGLYSYNTMKLLQRSNQGLVSFNAQFFQTFFLSLSLYYYQNQLSHLVLTPDQYQRLSTVMDVVTY